MFKRVLLIITDVCIFQVVAIAAAKVQKPVRIMLDRDDDMVISGYR